MRSQSVRHEVELSVRRDEGDCPVILEPSQSHTPANTQEQRTGHTVTTIEYAAVWHTSVDCRAGGKSGVRRIEDSPLSGGMRQKLCGRALVVARRGSTWKRFPSQSETGVSYKTACCSYVQPNPFHTIQRQRVIHNGIKIRSVNSLVELDVLKLYGLPLSRRPPRRIEQQLVVQTQLQLRHAGQKRLNQQTDTKRLRKRHVRQEQSCSHVTKRTV